MPRLIAELPDDVWVKLVDGAWVPNLQTDERDQRPLAQPIEVRGAGPSAPVEKPEPEPVMLPEPEPVQPWVQVDVAGGEPQRVEPPPAGTLADVLDAVKPVAVEAARQMLNEARPLQRMLTEPPGRIDGAAIPPGLAVRYELPPDAVPGQVWPRTRRELTREEAERIEPATAYIDWKVQPEAMAARVEGSHTPESVAWQRHVCAAWARALGKGDATAANAPSVIDLQDATREALAQATSTGTTHGVRMTARAWAQAVGMDVALTEPIPSVPEIAEATAARLAREHVRGGAVVMRVWAGALGATLRQGDEVMQLVEATVELVDREREQQHVVTNLGEQVAAHRATIARMMGSAPESASVNEIPAALVRRYITARHLWRATPHPDDQVHHDEMDACLDEMEKWVAAQTPPAAAEETDDDLPF